MPPQSNSFLDTIPAPVGLGKLPESRLREVADQAPADAIDPVPPRRGHHGGGLCVVERMASPPHRRPARLARENATLKTRGEGSVGFGAAVLRLLAETGALDRCLRLRAMTLPDTARVKTQRIYSMAGLDPRTVVEKVFEFLPDPYSRAVPRA